MTTTLAPLCASRAAVCSASCIARADRDARSAAAARSCDRRGRRSLPRRARRRRASAAQARRSSRDPLVVEQRAADLVRDEGDRLARGREHPAGAERGRDDDGAGGDRGAGDSPRPTRRTLARVPSAARSSTQTAPVLVASTATTVSAAPAESTATGAATETAIGSAESALASEIVDCAPACAWRSASAAGHGERPGAAIARKVGNGYEVLMATPVEGMEQSASLALARGAERALRCTRSASSRCRAHRAASWRA